ncbi:MAG: type II toxin-antitoxin system HicA family toxin [Chloroflexi bacterium]|nr:MAG: type II toxin-antitoxin system HicA family toxin [Chloroflexota bacterium]
MKLRKLKKILRQRGYRSRPGRGSHEVWTHPRAPHKPIVLCGSEGSDAQPYLVAQVFKDKRISHPRHNGKRQLHRRTSPGKH